MARGAFSLTRGNYCSYKRITIAICCVNVAALLIFRSLYSPRTSNSFSGANKYSEEQIKRINESIRIREESKPVELIKAVKKLKKELYKENKRKVKLPPLLKHKLANEILERLNGLKDVSNSTEEKEAVELWRVEKLRDLKSVSNGNLPSLVNSKKEAKMLRLALETNWRMVTEDIGLWLPADITNTEHDDKPDSVPDEEEIIAGPPLLPECNAEPHTDYDGVAVRWGLTHRKESAADCCKACLEQAKRAKPGAMKCNIWVYCPSEFGCYSPDIYEHKHQECWLKQADKPKLNFKDKYSESYRDSHPSAPIVVPWMSGVVST